jgi:chemotaxis protein MotB
MTARREAQRRQTQRAPNHRWLFGYADMLTLLFACYLGLHVGRTTASTQAATTIDAATPPIAGAINAPEQTPPPASPATAEASSADTDEAPPPSPEIQEAFRRIAAHAEGSPNLELTTDNRGLVLTLPEVGTFRPGRTELSSAARTLLGSLARPLRTLPYDVRVEGHTDDVPIRTAWFASNWELSTLRATEVVRFLIAEGGIAPARLSAAGYAEHRPRAPIDSPAGRARNRRVDIIVLDVLPEIVVARTDPR